MRTMKKIVEKVKEYLYKFWESTVFWVGDIKSISTFPWVTWAHNEYLMSFDETAESMPHILAGDIGLHRYKGYVANIAIPGYMKHAWIHVTDGDIVNPQVVEAVSEGVKRRNSTYAIWSDYTIILRPNVPSSIKSDAIDRSEEIVGENYDVSFKFDIEKERDYYDGKKMGKYDPAFSCTEVIGYAYWDAKEALNIKRVRARGKDILVPDNFITEGWDIVWVSKSVTLRNAKKLGLHEEGLAKLEEFLKCQGS